MINKFKTCYGCPDRSVGCHGTCKGYAEREKDKQTRYESHVTVHANREMNHRKESLLKRAGVLLDGRWR